MPRLYQGCDVDSVCAGFGPQKLATLAAYALRRNLLDWLETFKVEKLCAERLAMQKEASKVSSIVSKFTRNSRPSPKSKLC